MFFRKILMFNILSLKIVFFSYFHRNNLKNNFKKVFIFKE